MHILTVHSVGRGDSSHHATRGDSSLPRTPLFEGKKPENQKTVITIRILERAGYY